MQADAGPQGMGPQTIRSPSIGSRESESWGTGRGSAELVPAPRGTASAVYADLLRFGPRPRTELAARLGLSGPSLTRITRGLLDDGLIRELPPWPRPKGRPQEPLDIDEQHARFLGVKVSAAGVHAAIVTPRGSALEELVLGLRASTPEGVVATIVEVAAPLIGAHGRIAGIGITLPGVVEAGRRVRAVDLLGWQGTVDLAERVESALPQAGPVSVDNDFSALLDGLAWSGMGRRWSSFSVLTVGAGAAVGHVLAGRVLRGAHGVAGITERTPVPAPRGGARATWTLGEAARTAAVLERARRAGAIGPAGGIEELIAAARSGDPAALGIAREVADAGLAAAEAAIALVDPQGLVIGGESAALLDLGSDGDLEARLRSRLAPEQQELEIRRLSADFDEWARGAAVVAIRRFVEGA